MMTPLLQGAVERPTPTAARATVALPTSQWRIEPLWEARGRLTDKIVRGGPLPAALAARFGADLAIPLRADRPTIVANFVSTLDGIVALDRAGATGGHEISGGFEPDRFLMGLLRAAADAVLLGAGTVRASRTRAWTPSHVHPPSASAYARWRGELGLPPAPTAVVVTASGDLDSSQPRLASPDQPIIIATTDRGAARLRELGRRDRVEIVVLADDGRVPVNALLKLLRERGFALILSEAGPTLFGELLEARAIDELFLTVAPQVAGRSERSPRLGLVEGVGFPPAMARWGRLRGVMRSGDYLFLRYKLTTPLEMIGARK